MRKGELCFLDTHLEARPKGLEGAIEGKHDFAAVHLDVNVPPFEAGVLVDATVPLRTHARGSVTKTHIAMTLDCGALRWTKVVGFRQAKASC
jgi:hypothetical protein